MIISLTYSFAPCLILGLEGKITLLTDLERIFYQLNLYITNNVSLIFVLLLIYVDVDACKVNGTSVSPNILTTPSRPDIIRVADCKGMQQTRNLKKCRIKLKKTKQYQCILIYFIAI